MDECALLSKCPSYICDLDKILKIDKIFNLINLKKKKHCLISSFLHCIDPLFKAKWQQRKGTDMCTLMFTLLFIYIYHYQIVVNFHSDS